MASKPIAEQLQDKSAEVQALLDSIKPTDYVARKHLESAKRDIAMGFECAKRAVTPTASA